MRRMVSVAAVVCTICAACSLTIAVLGRCISEKQAPALLMWRLSRPAQPKSLLHCEACEPLQRFSVLHRCRGPVSLVRVVPCATSIIAALAAETWLQRVHSAVLWAAVSVVSFRGRSA